MTNFTATDLTAPTTRTISLNTAVARTQYWREFITNPDAAAVMKQIPKAVYISKGDIEGMYHALKADASLVGARAYFTLNEGPSAEAVKNNVTFCMVMVKHCDTSPCGLDVLPLPENSADDDDSGIYDYTKPCPEFCDEGSPLNGGDGECTTCGGK